MVTVDVLPLGVSISLDNVEDRMKEYSGRQVLSQDLASGFTLA